MKKKKKKEWLLFENADIFEVYNWKITATAKITRTLYIKRIKKYLNIWKSISKSVIHLEIDWRKTNWTRKNFLLKIQ